MNGDELDDLINRGMRAYTAQEPAIGLDARVLRRVHGRESRRAWFRWAGWAFAACAVMAIFAARTWQKPVETLAITPVWHTETPPMTAVRVPARAVHRKPGITAGERALLQFVQEHPEQALEAFARPQNPITVDEIEIPPVAIESLDPQEENKK